MEQILRFKEMPPHIYHIFRTVNARFVAFPRLLLKGHLIRYETSPFFHFFFKPYPQAALTLTFLPGAALIYGSAAQDLLWIFVSVICGIKESTLAFH